MIKIKSEQIIEVSDWDKLVSETYGRPYAFQQQDGCRGRETFYINVPEEAYDRPDTGDEGVSFATWLARDPQKQCPNQVYDWELKMFWQREFYPDVQMVANDLYEKGLIPAGEYGIKIDW